MLSVHDIDVFIQASQILRRVSLEVREREVVCLVGRNGAGKTTTLRTIMGYHRPRSGAVRFRDVALHEQPTHKIARLGLGFAAERLALAYEIFPVLKRYAARKGPEMSGGERKMLSIARALALDPDMLLLDEPFEGLSPAIVPTVARGIAEITERGRAILIAESNLHHVPDFATRLYVIERGEIIFAGRPDDVRTDAAALRATGGHA